MSDWTQVKDESPRPHSKYTVRRDGFVHTATPCYGMHDPWWVPISMHGHEIAAVTMRPTDEWSACEQKVKESENES